MQAEGSGSCSLRAASGLGCGSGDTSRYTANLFYHTPYYHDTALPSLDRYDLALDFGVLLGSDHGEMADRA